MKQISFKSDVNYCNINKLPITGAVARAGQLGPQPEAQNVSGADLGLVLLIF